MDDCDNGRKFRVVATARVPPRVTVDNQDYNIGSRTSASNTEASSAWLQEVPLPIQLAKLAVDDEGELDPDRWENVATEVFKNAGGHMKGWARNANCDLNGKGLFRWDIKLNRCLVPRAVEDGGMVVSPSTARKSHDMLKTIWHALGQLEQEDASAPEELREVLEGEMGEAPSTIGDMIVRWIRGGGGEDVLGDDNFFDNDDGNGDNAENGDDDDDDENDDDDDDDDDDENDDENDDDENDPDGREDEEDLVAYLQDRITELEESLEDEIRKNEKIGRAHV